MLRGYEYKFQVINATTKELLFKEGDLYTLTETIANESAGINVGAESVATVGPGGVFTLLHGQRATFKDRADGKPYEFLSKEEDTVYYVYEMFENGYEAQYGVYQVSGEGDGGEVEAIGGTTIGEFKALRSTDFAVKDGTGYIIFKNKVDVDLLSKLSVRKLLAADTTPSDEEFQMQIKLKGVLLGTDATYTLYDADGNIIKSTVDGDRNVLSNGIIKLKAGQEAVLDGGLLVGTPFTVEEIEADSYTVRYAGDIGELNLENWGNITWGTMSNFSSSTGVAAGEIDKLSQAYRVTVTNSEYDVSVGVPLEKTLTGWKTDDDDYPFGFLAKQVTKEMDGTYTELTDGYTNNAGITIDTTNSKEGTIYIGYKSSDVDVGTHYYKIVETKQGITEGGVDYDDTYYIVAVVVAEEGTTVTARVDKVTQYVDGKPVEQLWYEYGSGNPTATLNPLPFINQLVGDLSITKTVNRTDKGSTDGNFNFEVLLKDSAGAAVSGTQTYSYAKGTEAGTIIFKAGKISAISAGGVHSGNSIILKHGEMFTIEGLPVGTKATITETTTDGYSVVWTGDINVGEVSEKPSISSDSATSIGIKTGNTTAVICTNTTGAVLPSTGGMGVRPILTLGALLVFGAGTMLLMQRRRKEGFDGE